jgi:outer membrane lipoprotein-sorting protein
MFEVKKLPPATDDPGGTVHVQLIPKEGTDFKSRFSTIDFWIDPASVMPVRIVTQDPNGTTTRTTELKDIKVNTGLGDKDFQMPPVDEKQWTIRSQAYED